MGNNSSQEETQYPQPLNTNTLGSYPATFSPKEKQKSDIPLSFYSEEINTDDIIREIYGKSKPN